MMKVLCFLFVVWMPATFISGVNIHLKPPVCDNPIFNNVTQVFTMKCRAENITPKPECTLRSQSQGDAITDYGVDYTFTPACCGSDLFNMSCTIAMKAEDFTCGVQYQFAVAATLSGGSFSSGGAVYSSPVTYGELGNCPKSTPKVSLKAPACDNPVFNSVTQVFTMKCRADNITNNPQPKCTLRSQSKGDAITDYGVDYTFTPACCGSDLFNMSCTITMKAEDFTCGVQYRFAVAATLYGDLFSEGGIAYSSPVTYGELGNCPKAPVPSTAPAGKNSGPIAVISTRLLFFLFFVVFYSFI